MEASSSSQTLPRSAHVTSNESHDSSSPVLEIYPRQCNLHTITAIESCAFIDVALPSYSEARPCTYYKEHLLASHELAQRIATDCTLDPAPTLNGQSARQPAKTVLLVPTSDIVFDVAIRPYKGPSVS